MVEFILITGFLGSGKTTLLNKILPCFLKNKKTAIIENDFGDTSIDSIILNSYGLPIKELSSGCICCSLSSDLVKLCEDLINSESPQLVLIEPSGLGKTSDIINSLFPLIEKGKIQISNIINLVDCANFWDYIEDFGDFFGNQIESASKLALSHTEGLNDKSIKKIKEYLRQINDAPCFSENWIYLSSEKVYGYFNDSLSTIKEELCVSSEHAHHHHDHSANQFMTVSLKADGLFEEAEIKSIFEEISLNKNMTLLRAKGFLKSASDTGSLHFDYLPGHIKISPSKHEESIITFIGRNLNKALLEDKFKIC